MDTDEKIVLVNGNTERMFGYTREELMGQSLETLIPEDVRGVMPSTTELTSPTAKTRPMGIGLDLDGRRKDGTTFPVEIGLSAIETAGGNLGVAFVSDITQRRQLESAAQTHAQEVQALAASLMTAQEDERRRVSGLLHDQICQQLAALAIDIGSFAAGPLRTAQGRLKAFSGARRRSFGGGASHRL